MSHISLDYCPLDATFGVESGSYKENRTKSTQKRMTESKKNSLIQCESRCLSRQPRLAPTNDSPLFDFATNLNDSISPGLFFAPFPLV
eukprot:04133_5